MQDLKSDNEISFKKHYTFYTYLCIIINHNVYIYLRLLFQTIFSKLNSNRDGRELYE